MGRLCDNKLSFLPMPLRGGGGGGVGRLCDNKLSFLPMPLGLSVKYQSKLPKRLLVGGKCLNMVNL